MEFEPGTSAETTCPLRSRHSGGGSGSANSSQAMTHHSQVQSQCSCLHVDTERDRAHATTAMHSTSVSQQSSPRSLGGGLPSPPDSPAPSISDSLSSFPSVGSSFFFSSGAASPHHFPHDHDQRDGHGARRRRAEYYANSQSDPDSGAESGVDPVHALIIPSLTLPAPVPQPTPHGQTLGEVSLLIVGPSSTRWSTKGASDSLSKVLAEFLADADDVVDVCEWEELGDHEANHEEIENPGVTGKESRNAKGRRKARILHASTDWLEERDLHGLERFEGTKNVAFVELESFNENDSTEDIVEDMSDQILDIFRDTAVQLGGSLKSSSLLHALLSSGSSGLYTALVYITSSPPSSQDNAIISSLSKLLPVIPFSSTSVAHLYAFSHRDRHRYHDHDFHFESSSLPSSDSHSHPESRSHSHSRDPEHGRVKFSSHQQGKGEREQESPPSSPSPFLPHTPLALRAALFRAPHTLASLRAEAASRFLRWLEVERLMENNNNDTIATTATTDGPVNPLTVPEETAKLKRRSVKRKPGAEWSKEEWETELSLDYARRLRELRSPPSSCSYTSASVMNEKTARGCSFAPTLDPLHFPSVVLLSLSLLTPRPFIRPVFVSHPGVGVKEAGSTPALFEPERSEAEHVGMHSGFDLDSETKEKTKAKSGNSPSRRSRTWAALRWGVVLVGAFCAGVGIGMVLSS